MVKKLNLPKEVLKRCSIVCDNSHTLNLVIDNFINLINAEQNQTIIKIVRIKNGSKNVS